MRTPFTRQRGVFSFELSVLLAKRFRLKVYDEIMKLLAVPTLKPLDFSHNLT